jgi:hypothetical protein
MGNYLRNYFLRLFQVTGWSRTWALIPLDSLYLALCRFMHCTKMKSSDSFRFVNLQIHKQQAPIFPHSLKLWSWGSILPTQNALDRQKYDIAHKCLIAYEAIWIANKKEDMRFPNCKWFLRTGLLSYQTSHHHLFLCCWLHWLSDDICMEFYFHASLAVLGDTTAY